MEYKNNISGLNGWFNKARWKKILGAIGIIAPLVGGPVGAIIGAAALGVMALLAPIDWSSIPAKYRNDLQDWHSNIAAPLIQYVSDKTGDLTDVTTEAYKNIINETLKELAALKAYYEYQTLQAAPNEDTYLSEQKAIIIGVFATAIEQEFFASLENNNPYKIVSKSFNAMVYDTVGNQPLYWSNPGLGKVSINILARYNAFVEKENRNPENKPPVLVLPPDFIIKPPHGDLPPNDGGYNGGGINPGGTTYTPPFIPTPTEKPPFSIPAGEGEGEQNNETNKYSKTPWIIGAVLAALLIFKKK